MDTLSFITDLTFPLIMVSLSFSFSFDEIIRDSNGSIPPIPKVVAYNPFMCPMRGVFQGNLTLIESICVTKESNVSVVSDYAIDLNDVV
jgi:hypothetical protein